MDPLTNREREFNRGMSGQEQEEKLTKEGVNRRKFLAAAAAAAAALTGGLAIGAGAGPVKDQLKESLELGPNPEKLWQRDLGNILGSYIGEGVYSSNYLRFLTEELPLVPDKDLYEYRQNYFTKFTWGRFRAGESMWQGELREEEGLRLPIRIEVDYTRDGKIEYLHITANIARLDIPKFRPFIVGPEQKNLGEEFLFKAANQFFKPPWPRHNIRWTAGNPLQIDPRTTSGFTRGELAFVKGEYRSSETGLDMTVEVNTKGEADLKGVRSS